MSVHHAIALASIGWYLMLPPTAADLDGACNHQSLFWSAMRMFASEITHISETKRCHQLRHQVATDAPFSKWKQIGEFETLAECRAGNLQDYKLLSSNGEIDRMDASQELADEGNLHPSEDQLSERIRELSTEERAATLDEKCVASDDPRLKEK